MGDFNFTKDLLESLPNDQKRDEVANELVELKQKVESDPTGLVEYDAHVRLNQLKNMATTYAKQRDGKMPPGFEIDSWEYRVINLIEEQFWSKDGEIPTLEKFIYRNAEYYDNERNRKRLAKLWEKKGFWELLRRRGIEPPAYSDSENGPVGLSPQQLLAANFMLNLHDTRTEREKLKELGISSHKWNAWLQDPRFSEYLRKRSENLFGAHDHVAYSGLIKAVENNDLQAIKLFMEMRGIYNPKMEVQVNVQHIMTRVVEIITRHVKDPHTLEIMAGELAQIEGAR